MYEIRFAVRTATILTQNFIGHISHKVSTVRTNVFPLELLVSLL